MKLKLTVKNYRGYGEDNPLEYVVDSGFAAFVGKNNSGKSTAIRFLYESRELWQRIANGDFGNHIFAGAQFHWQFFGVQDQAEVFHDYVAPSITIRLDVIDAEHDKEGDVRYFDRIEVEIDRVTHSKRVSIYWNDRRLDHSFGSHSSRAGYSGTVRAQQGAHWYSLVSILEAAKSLSAALYLPSFRNAINAGAGSHFDISVGTGFVNLWREWKTGPNKSQNLAISRVTNELRRIFEISSLEINPSSDGNHLRITINDKPFRDDEVGSGFVQFILAMGNVAIRAPDYILVDEPELNLHPALQIDFLTSLASFAKRGVLFATHSLGLARSVAERIYAVHRSDSGSMLAPLEETPRFAEFVGAMNFSGHRELGFESVLLVEGVTDVKTTQQLLRLLKKEHKVVVFPMGGDQLARKGVGVELEEVKRITPRIFVLVDSERKEEGSPLIFYGSQFTP